MSGRSGRARQLSALGSAGAGTQDPFLPRLQVWMLTGDKLETATCTAKNAHLVTRNQDVHVFRLVKPLWGGSGLWPRDSLGLLKRGRGLATWLGRFAWITK